MGSFPLSLFCHSVIFYHEGVVKKYQLNTRTKVYSWSTSTFLSFSLCFPLLQLPGHNLHFSVHFGIFVISWSSDPGQSEFNGKPTISYLTENYRNTIRKSKIAFIQLWTHFTSQLQIKILYNCWDKEENTFLPAIQRSLPVLYVTNTFTRSGNVRDS